MLVCNPVVLAALALPWQQILSLLICNSSTRSPKSLNNISKFNLIIVNFEKNNHITLNLKQLVLEFFKSVAFFGTPGSC